MYSEHQKDIFLQTELHTYKLHSYSWLCKYPTRDKQMNTDLTQQIQTCAVLKSSHLSSGICLLWFGFLFPHFLSTPNTESTFFKKSSTEKVPFFCTLKQLVFGPQWQLQGSQHLSAILPQVQSPSWPTPTHGELLLSPHQLFQESHSQGRIPVSHSQAVWVFIN